MCASQRHFHYSVFDSSLSIRVEEADKSQVGGKGVQAFTASVKLATVLLPHTMVL